MGIIPLHLQRRFEQRWAARFAGHRGSADESRIERLAGQHALRPAKAKEKPAVLRVKAQGK
jgi:hypothetical protein